MKNERITYICGEPFTAEEIAEINADLDRLALEQAREEEELHMLEEMDK